MKIIISHDVDHLSWREHLGDTFFPGLLLRSIKGLGSNGLSFLDLWKRFTRAKLTQAVELCEFNKQNGITPTFFFGMRKGLNLSYSWEDAGILIQELIEKGAHIGLHGMAYDSIEKLRIEKTRICSLLPNNYPLGIRNHYLRKNEHTLPIMSELDFVYDSTHYELKPPFREGKLWEIPISFMDAGIITHGKNNADQIKSTTLDLLASAKEKGLPFFVVNFHDTFFCKSYPFHLAWYKWLIRHFDREGYQYCTFLEAVSWLEATAAKDEN